MVDPEQAMIALMMQGDTCMRADAPSVLGLVIGLVCAASMLCRPPSRFVSVKDCVLRCNLFCLPFCACLRGSVPPSWSVRQRGFAAEVEVLGECTETTEPSATRLVLRRLAKLLRVVRKRCLCVLFRPAKHEINKAKSTRRSVGKFTAVVSFAAPCSGIENRCNPIRHTLPIVHFQEDRAAQIKLVPDCQL